MSACGANSSMIARKSMIMRLAWMMKSLSENLSIKNNKAPVESTKLYWGYFIYDLG